MLEPSLVAFGAELHSGWNLVPAWGPGAVCLVWFMLCWSCCWPVYYLCITDHVSSFPGWLACHIGQPVDLSKISINTFVFSPLVPLSFSKFLGCVPGQVLILLYMPCKKNGSVALRTLCWHSFALGFILHTVVQHWVRQGHKLCIY